MTQSTARHSKRWFTPYRIGRLHNGVIWASGLTSVFAFGMVIGVVWAR